MNSLPRSSRTLHLRHRDLSSAGGSQSVTSVSVVRPMQRLMPRVADSGLDAMQDDVAVAEPVLQRSTTEARAPIGRPARSLKPVVIPREAMYPSTPATAAPAVASVSLLQGCKTVQIMHNGEPYTLRATKHGKLILTK